MSASAFFRAGVGMSAHPAYPSAAELYAERTFDRMMADQAAATDAYVKLANAFLTGLLALETPLGSVSLHWEMEDIEAMIRDTLVGRDSEKLEDAAMDAAREEAW